MSTLHAVLGAAMVAANLVAGLWGAWCWWRVRPSRVFWILLRTAQAITVLVAAQGAVLAATGAEMPRLHLVYGLTPLGVSFLAEQLRVASAQTVLDQRGLESSLAVGRLPEAEQRALVLDIIRREIGVMAASALVACILGLRASGLL
jgi:hypothetical protein